MAKISLRVYHAEIKDMIDQGQFDSAIAHGLHILKTYSKNIDTYRLIGNAYLENEQFADASDIMQRVLSSVPDDFVAQVGMSIIREDEGDLDAAIYHMERTFESQPSNLAIQEELKRLYGKRDGIEPKKIRLTRGALARMYVHGNLYEQAIAELTAALSDDPSRLDLKILLAELYFEMGNDVETSDLCIAILEKLPNNYSANKLLYKVLDKANRKEEAKIYQERWVALDPYAAFINPKHPKPEDVPDQMVQLDRLEGDGFSFGESLEQGDGRKATTADKAASSDWMFTIKEEPDSELDETQDAEPETLAAAMAELENLQADEHELGQYEEETKPILLDSETPADIEQADDEIPGWILADEEEPQESLATSEDKREDPAERLEDLITEAPLSMRHDAEIEDEEEDEASVADLPLSDLAEGLKSFEGPLPEEKDELLEELIGEGGEAEIPDWLKSLSDTSPIIDESVETAETEEPTDQPILFNIEDQEETPDWIKELANNSLSFEEKPSVEKISPEDLEISEFSVLDKQAEDDIPDWIRDLEKVERPEIEENPIPDWLAAAATPTEDSDEVRGEDDVADWLTSLSEEESTDEMDTGEEAIPFDEALFAEETTPSTEPLEAITSAEAEGEIEVSEDLENLEIHVKDESYLTDVTSQLEPDNLIPMEQQKEFEEFFSEASTAEAEEDPETSEWLKSLLDEKAGLETEDEEEDDWLNSISDINKAEDIQTDGDADWLKELDSVMFEQTLVPENNDPVTEPDQANTGSAQPEASVTEEEALLLESDLSAEEIELEPETAPTDIAELNLETNDQFNMETESLLKEVDSIGTTPKENSEEDKAVFDEIDWLEAENEFNPRFEEGDASVEEPELASDDWLLEALGGSEAGEPELDPTEEHKLSANLEIDEELELPEPEPLTEQAGVQEDWVRELDLKTEVEEPKQAKPVSTAKPPAQNKKLEELKQVISGGSLEQAIKQLRKIIRSGKHLEEAIGQINVLLRKYPLDIQLWETMGDALMKQNKLQEAMDAYTKAEELIR